MMLNIRLVYSASPYALMRFKLPENLFSVFVRVMASALELWCLPSMTIGNIIDFIRKQDMDDETKKWLFTYQSIFWSWANFATFGILWIVYVIGGDQGNVTAFYWVIAASGFVFGINMVMVYAMEFWYLPYYMVGENSFPMVTSLMHYVSTSIFGNRRKYDSDYIVVYVDIVISLAISFVAAVLWTCCYYSGTQGYPPKDSNQKDCVTLKLETKTGGTATELTYSIGTDYGNKDVFGAHIKTTGDKCKYQGIPYYLYLVPPSLMVLVGMGLVYTIYPGIAPGMIVPFYLVDKIEMILLIATAFPPVIIKLVPVFDERFDPYVLKGSWGVYHKKVCKAGDEQDPGPTGCPEYTEKIKSIKLAISNSGTGGNIHTITLSDGGSGSAGVLSTSNAINLATNGTGTLTIKIPGGEIALKELSIGTGNKLTIKSGNSKVSVTKMTWGQEEPVMLNETAALTTSGKTLTINSGGGGTDATINITGDTNVELNYSGGTSEITISGSAIDALGARLIATDELHDNHKTDKCCLYGKVYKWSDEHPNAVYWNIFNILMPLQICLASIFIYSIHYRDSLIARVIVNQPKMSTALSILFYMCHEILLAVGFPGIASDDDVLLPMQLVGAFLMVLLAFYSIGYITEYKRHDPSQWPTTGMTKWNALCYWLKMASKIKIKI
ncbi:Tpr-related protein family member, putative [Theileria annulata]|uniref:Tpr-related protein family member, putative n=1 Tax=Theileria annulata TaxID=5874 RepID=Q4UHS0_THEAN|nr:Tpr-related protein family member, putative [Theileria annulata]CAI73369.1 Tpr-related protein family member, putative [Theileria annulata]|eukprot:XP_954046.1 Tpr-related protein family member, putative [Theileria annulata]